MITSAGCNALDYALLAPRAIYCIDMNPRQNALLELKMAAIRTLDFETFFQWFGLGSHPQADGVYRALLRPTLSVAARAYWDRHIHFFAGTKRPSFYFHGTSGWLAWMINLYIDRVARVRHKVMELLDAPTLAEQARIYHEQLHEAFWQGKLRWALGKDATLSLMGVPRPQRRQVERTYPGGIARFIEDRIAAVFTRLPLRDNYFWRVYLTGRYSRDCCPEYLKAENFARLKGGLVDAIVPYTGPLVNFLERYRGKISRFVLLDHMDWLSTHLQSMLQRQWQALLQRSAPHSRILWRSGGLSVDFVDPIEVTVRRKTRRLGELLLYQRELAQRLHAQDRVHTYGSFYIADLNLA
jgi:S-adenosylmethionine-diacylglycerol 3-amino-3-carboxypropyl transferase